MEERLLRGGHEVFRQMLEKGAQLKADQAPPICPVCQNKLSRWKQGHRTGIQTRFGVIRIQRARGYCKRCRKWRFPADALLGLPEEGTQSPAVQEMAALTVSKMPAPEAEQVVERLAGVKISAATLARQACQQGQRAEQKRKEMDGQMSQPEGRGQQDHDLQLKLALEPFTLVIELDAWNIRECDAWGQSKAMRQSGEEPSRWHWAYGGTCFRLSQRTETAGGRPTILSRGYAMTREGTDALKEQLWAEAMRHGLGRANEVLIVADGAAWIWNLAGDRFAGARQRVDFYHVSQHLWAVAHAMHPDDEAAAKAWVQPMLDKLKADASCEVITDLKQLRERLEGSARQQVDKEVHDPRLKKVAFKSTKKESHFMAFRIPYTSYVGTKHETIDFIEENLVFDSLGEDLGRSTICKPIVIGWTTERPANVANRLAAERWNRPADNTKPASSALGSFGVKPETKH
jgi:hypothetical protein